MISALCVSRFADNHILGKVQQMLSLSLRVVKILEFFIADVMSKLQIHRDSDIIHIIVTRIIRIGILIASVRRPDPFDIWTHRARKIDHVDPRSFVCLGAFILPAIPSEAIIGTDFHLMRKADKHVNIRADGNFVFQILFDVVIILPVNDILKRDIVRHPGDHRKRLMPDSAQSEFLYALFLTPVFEPADNLRFFLKTVEFIQLFYVQPHMFL